MEYQIKYAQYDEAVEVLSRLKEAAEARRAKQDITDDNAMTTTASTNISAVETNNITAVLPVDDPHTEFISPSPSCTQVPESTQASDNMKQLLESEYIDKELASHYTTAFLHHLHAYKLAFRECTYVKNNN
jgi:hypothetical protein